MVTSSSTPAPSDVVLLDTNILLIYARAGEPSRQLEAQLGLQGGRVQGVISVICIGEALAFAQKNNWGQTRRKALMELIRAKLVPIDINRPEIFAAYAAIDHYCEKVMKPARCIGQNDLWIAATAHVLQCELVTTDRDFDHLHGVKMHRRWIDPSSLVPRKS
jgi:predicted nucleic acid-binding protein